MILPFPGHVTLRASSWFSSKKKKKKKKLAVKSQRRHGGNLSEISPFEKAAAAAAKLLQSCPTLCDPIDSSPAGSIPPGILQARTLEWVAISCSNAWKWKVKVNSLSQVRLFSTPWTQPTRLLRPWDFPGKSTGVGAAAFSTHCITPTMWRSEKAKLLLHNNASQT